MAYTILEPYFIDDSGGGFLEWFNSAAWEPADIAPDNHGAFVSTAGSVAAYGTHKLYQTVVFTDWATPSRHALYVIVNDYTAVAPGHGIDVYFGATLVGTITSTGTYTFDGFPSSNDELAFIAKNNTVAVLDHVVAADYVVSDVPLEWSPVYNPIQFTVDSVNNVECNFKYIADVYVDGEYVTRLELFPDLTGKATFEFNRVLQPYVSFDLNVELQGFNRAENTYCSYQINFGEQYDDSTSCDGVIDEYTDIVISDLGYTWHATLSLEEWSTYTNDTYKLNIVNEVPFLTHQPTITSIHRGDYAQLMYIQDNDFTASPYELLAERLRVTTYDYIGNIIGEYDITNDYAPDSNKLITVGVGYQNILDAENSGSPATVTIVSGTFPIFKSIVTTYDVVILSEKDQEMTERKTYKIECVLPVTPRRFVWVGLLGNMDSFKFTGIETQSNSIQRNEFTKLNTGFTIRDRGRRVIDVDIRERFISNSGWLSVKESNWISELAESSEVYILQSAPSYCYYGEISLSTRWNLFISANSTDDMSSLSGFDFILIDDNNTTLTESIAVMNNNVAPTGINSSIYTVTEGFIIAENFQPEYTPIIATLGTFDFRIKRNIKNISIPLEYELANSKQIQRN